MPGGLLNIAATGNQNIIIHGNPTKTYFKSTYAKHTNFGIQKFRIDHQGLRSLQINSPTEFTFKIPRYADLLMDIYLVIDLPDIWSPVLAPTGDTSTNIWRPYEFKWIKNIGTNLIQQVRFTIGGHEIQKYTGNYLQNFVERDFDESKKKLFDIMTGNIEELNDPAKYYNGNYPNTFNFSEDDINNNILPSIRNRRLYIPINIWFTLMSKMAFPLVSLQYNELQIEFKLRPITELFVVRDINNPVLKDYTQTEYISVNTNNNSFHLYRFLQQPPLQILNGNSHDKYPNNNNNWNSNIHILANYCFLDKDEVNVFTSRPQQYLIKECKEYNFYNLIGSNLVELETKGLVTNFMWFVQRADIYMRNEWSNYTNWKYSDIIPNIPNRVRNKIINISYNNISLSDNLNVDGLHYDPSYQYLMYFNDNYLNNETNLYLQNQKFIINEFAILLDGKYRENLLNGDIYNYVDYYIRSSGKGKDGLYFYNFGLSTNPYSNQPNGAINLSKFNKVQFQVNLIQPPISDIAMINEICDDDGSILGIEKTNNNLYKYTFNLTVQEEKYNILSFINGNAALMYS